MVRLPCGRYVHGLRVVCPPYSSEDGPSGCVLEVFDFNVHPKKLPGVDDANRSTNFVGAPGHGVNAEKGTKGDINGL